MTAKHIIIEISVVKVTIRFYQREFSLRILYRSTSYVNVTAGS